MWTRPWERKKGRQAEVLRGKEWGCGQDLGRILTIIGKWGQEDASTESGASVRFTTTFQELLGTDVQGWIGGFVSVVSGMEIPSHEHSSF